MEAGDKCVCGLRFANGPLLVHFWAMTRSGRCYCTDYWIDAVPLFFVWMIQNDIRILFSSHYFFSLLQKVNVGHLCSSLSQTPAHPVH